jgi:hypothetical protein
MSFIQVSESTGSALDLGTAVRTYSEPFIIYNWGILVDLISAIFKFNVDIGTSSMLQSVGYFSGENENASSRLYRTATILIRKAFGAATSFIRGSSILI